MRFSSEHGHREAVIASRVMAIGLEGLLVRGDVEDPAPMQCVAHRQNRVEMASMERIEGAPADSDVHPLADAAGSGCCSFSRTKRASFRTRSFTPCPVTAEISWYS